MERTQHIATGVAGLKGNEILAMIQRTKEGTMVAIKPMCDAMRIAWGRQFEKLTEDKRFNCSHMRMVGSDGKCREMLCLPAEQVPMWINSINSNKVGEEKREALLELHKFFGYALNEFSRERYITKDEFRREMAIVQGQLNSAIAIIEKLVKENEVLRKANGFRAKAASYQMHARKTEVNH